MSQGISSARRFRLSPDVSKALRLWSPSRSCFEVLRNLFLVQCDCGVSKQARRVPRELCFGSKLLSLGGQAAGNVSNALRCQFPRCFCSVLSCCSCVAVGSIGAACCGFAQSCLVMCAVRAILAVLDSYDCIHFGADVVASAWWRVDGASKLEWF